MERPPGIAFANEIEWVCKEPALVIWNDRDRSDISSLGLPCPTGKPTLLTLWIGQDATKSTYIMLHLRISVRVSKRRKTLDHFLLPSSVSSVTESCSIVNVENASETVRQSLEEAYGKSSTKKCLRVAFHQSKQGRVLMPLVPEGAPCLAGTALHLLTLFRSLSHAETFEIFVGHSSYAQHALMNLESCVLADDADIDLPRTYNVGGVFDDWRQIEAGRAVDRARPRKKVASEQPTCSPPPYSPPLPATKLPATPQAKACLKRSRASTSPETNRASPKSARKDTPPSPTFSNVLNVPESIVRSFSLESTAYSPTIINTPSTVGDTPSIKPTIFTTTHEPPRYATNVDDKVHEQAQDQVLNKAASSSISTSGSLDAILPKSIMRSLNKELRALVSAQVPLLTEQALQRIMDELLSSLEYSQKVAEVGLQEASDDLKVELQLEKDKGIEEIDEHAQETLTDVKSQMEDLANGHLLAFEDMLQQTGEQLKQTLQVLLEVLAKAIRMGKERHDDQADAPQSPLHSPAATATKLFLHEFGDLCTTAKVKVLDRLASQHTAEIFLTVDAELREAWVASWTGQP